MGCYLRTRRATASPRDMARLFERFPILAERRHQAAGTLSGGEQQMLAISRALMSPAQAGAVRRALARPRAQPRRAHLRHHQGHPRQGVTVVMVEQNALRRARAVRPRLRAGAGPRHARRHRRRAARQPARQERLSRSVTARRSLPAHRLTLTIHRHPAPLASVARKRDQAGTQTHQGEGAGSFDPASGAAAALRRAPRCDAGAWVPGWSRDHPAGARGAGMTLEQIACAYAGWNQRPATTTPSDAILRSPIRCSPTTST